MNKIVKKTLPVLLTSAAVIIALLVLRQLWVYYMDEPWDRDAHVGADVVQVAPDVSGGGNGAGGRQPGGEEG